MSSPPRLFDRRLLRRRLDRATRSPAQADFLRERVAADLAWRVAGSLRDFPLAVELAGRDGAVARAMAATGAKVGRLIIADLHARPGVELVLDEERLPFAPRSLDLIVSVLALHWTNDLPGVLAQARRALRPGGLFLAAMFGGATLTELRQALLSAETETRGGAGWRVAPFADGKALTGLLQRAGFADPAGDVDLVTVRYSSLPALVRDLRAMGETAHLAERPPPLTRAAWTRAGEVYGEQFADTDGRLRATFEIVTLTAWAPAR